jgi:hypothetical protein
MTEILADEVQHAKIGWRLLGELGPRLDREAKERMGEYLALAFRQLFERHYVPPRLTTPVGVPTVGVDDRREAGELFLDVVSDVIIPGLQAHGLDAATAARAALS